MMKESSYSPASEPGFDPGQTPFATRSFFRIHPYEPIPPFLPGNAPLELKADPGLPGQILRPVDDWILREAGRRDDCWRFLLGVSGMPDACKDLFKAAESASRALKHLIAMTWGGATLNRNLLGEFQEQKGCEKARIAEKVFRQLDKYHDYCRDDDPQTSDEAREWIEAVRAKGKRKNEEHALPITRRFPAASMMVYGWLRWGTEGEPGLCFFSDEALADFLTLTLDLEKRDGLGTRTVYYRQIRKRLGLVSAYYRKPTIVKVRRKEFKRRDTGEPATCIEIESRNGQRVPLTFGFVDSLPP